MKINKFLILSIIFIAIAVCISILDDFFRDFLDDSIIVLVFYIFGIGGIILDIIALRHHKRESNKFSIYSVSLVILIVVTTLFLIVMPPCQCGSRPKARDARIQSDMYQLRLIAEDYYENNNSYTGFEKDPIAIKIRDDIIEMKGTNLIISISPDGKQYCAEVLLNKEGWFCVDDTSTAKEYNGNPKCSSDYFSCENETADWQIYRNEEYGFEIKYPADFMPHQLSSSGILFRVGFWDKNCSMECGSVEISIRAEEGKTFQQIKEEAESNYSLLFSKNIGLEETTVDGKQAYIQPGYEFRLGGFTVVDEKYIYDISRWYSEKDVPEELFNQMLSTFRFLE